MKRAAFALAALAFSLISGCASITIGRNQPISVETTCGKQSLPGALCKLTNDKGQWYVSNTPGSVTIQKAFGNMTLECEKAGVGKGVGAYKSSVNVGTFGNIIAGGIIGMAIDAGSGAGFDYPQLMIVDICNGQTRPDVFSKSAKTTKDWLENANGYAKSVNCSVAPFGPVVTAWGAERYNFQCTTRRALYLECYYGSCKEVEPS